MAGNGHAGGLDRSHERTTAALEGMHPLLGSSLLGVGGFRGRLQFVSLRLRSNYDARLPPGGFAGVFPLPWFAKGEA